MIPDSLNDPLNIITNELQTWLSSLETDSEKAPVNPDMLPTIAERRLKAQRFADDYYHERSSENPEIGSLGDVISGYDFTLKFSRCSFNTGTRRISLNPNYLLQVELDDKQNPDELSPKEAELNLLLIEEVDHAIFTKLNPDYVPDIDLSDETTKYELGEYYAQEHELSALQRKIFYAQKHKYPDKLVGDLLHKYGQALIWKLDHPSISGNTDSSGKIVIRI